MSGRSLRSGTTTDTSFTPMSNTLTTHWQELVRAARTSVVCLVSFLLGHRLQPQTTCFAVASPQPLANKSLPSMMIWTTRSWMRVSCPPLLSSEIMEYLGFNLHRPKFNILYTNFLVRYGKSIDFLSGSNLRMHLREPFSGNIFESQLWQ